MAGYPTRYDVFLDIPDEIAKSGSIMNALGAVYNSLIAAARP